LSFEIRSLRPIPRTRFLRFKNGWGNTGVTRGFLFLFRSPRCPSPVFSSFARMPCPVAKKSPRCERVARCKFIFRKGDSSE